jgi:hypothetical protein
MTGHPNVRSPGWPVFFVAPTLVSDERAIRKLVIRCPALFRERLGGQHRKEDLDLLTEPSKAGQVKPVVDRVCSLSELPKALRYPEKGLALGKVVIPM